MSVYLLVCVSAHWVQVLLYLLHGPFQLIRTEGGLDLFRLSAKTERIYLGLVSAASATTCE